MTDSAKLAFIDPDRQIVTLKSPAARALNPGLSEGFNHHAHNPEVKRSHLFNGRYENIYLNESHIPELKTLLEEACIQAEKVLGTGNLKAGCWFNHMPPGSVTLPHRHDDNDELLAAVYYVCVPQNSGDLILPSGENTHRITPQEGMFVFFRPDAVHEVSENCSNSDRLSIGMNFGKKRH